MKRAPCLLTGLAAVLATSWSVPAPLSAQAFEGVIKQRVTTIMPQGVAALAADVALKPWDVLVIVAGRQNKLRGGVVRQDVTVSVKGGKMRIDGAGRGAGPGVYSILDAPSSAVYTVVPSQRMIVVASPQDAAAAQKRLQGLGMPTPSKAAPALSSLGTQRMNNVQARGYRLVTPDEAAIVWVDPALAPALAAFDSLQAQMAAGASSLQASVLALGFPVLSQVVTKTPPMMGQGWMFTESKITSVKRQRLADGLFGLPDGYRVVKPGQLPRPGS